MYKTSFDVVTRKVTMVRNDKKELAHKEVKVDDVVKVESGKFAQSIFEQGHVKERIGNQPIPERLDHNIIQPLKQRMVE